jgi:hypothetical protein
MFKYIVGNLVYTRIPKKNFASSPTQDSSEQLFAGVPTRNFEEARMMNLDPKVC